MPSPGPDSGFLKRVGTDSPGSGEPRWRAGPVLTGGEYAQSESAMALATTVVDQSERGVSDATGDTWALELPTNDYRTTRQ